ncbi:Serine/threonine-protein kinase STY17, partial [Cucurbita argyrosperma subsp. argyrosperma]
MENITAQLKRGISRQFSTGSLRRSLSRQFSRQSSLDPRRNNMRFSFGRQSSLDPIRRCPDEENELSVPENLDSTMQLLFMACRGDVRGVQDLLNDGTDVNSIDLDGRTALHIAACEGHAEKSRKTPMTVANPREVPEYELNPLELQIRRGDVFTCISLQGTYQVAKWNGTKVSVKILDRDCYSNPDSINAFKHELTLLEKVRHPNVVQFVGAVTQNLPMMIVSEYHPKGDLGCYLQKKGRLSPSKALRFALDIARQVLGMNYLHECKPDPIIHCDLKPKNILLDNGGLLKVAGFGLIRLSKLSADKAKLAHPVVIDHSNMYLAPEIYRDEIFDRSVDAFSFGLILYEMVEGIQPLHPRPPEEAAKAICAEGKRPPFKIKLKSYPPDLKELIEECWDPEPVMRPTFSEIILPTAQNMDGNKKVEELNSLSSEVGKVIMNEEQFS